MLKEIKSLPYSKMEYEEIDLYSLKLSTDYDKLINSSNNKPRWVDSSFDVVNKDSSRAYIKLTAYVTLPILDDTQGILSPPEFEKLIRLTYPDMRIKDEEFTKVVTLFPSKENSVYLWRLYRILLGLESVSSGVLQKIWFSLSCSSESVKNRFYEHRNEILSKNVGIYQYLFSFLARNLQGRINLCSTDLDRILRNHFDRVRSQDSGFIYDIKSYYVDNIVYKIIDLNKSNAGSSYFNSIVPSLYITPKDDLYNMRTNTLRYLDVFREKGIDPRALNDVRNFEVPVIFDDKMKENIRSKKYLLSLF